MCGVAHLQIFSSIKSPAFQRDGSVHNRFSSSFIKNHQLKIILDWAKFRKWLIDSDVASWFSINRINNLCNDERVVPFTRIHPFGISNFSGCCRIDRRIRDDIPLRRVESSSWERSTRSDAQCLAVLESLWWESDIGINHNIGNAIDPFRKVDRISTIIICHRMFNVATLIAKLDRMRNLIHTNHNNTVGRDKCALQIIDDRRYIVGASNDDNVLGDIFRLRTTSAITKVNLDISSELIGLRICDFSNKYISFVARRRRRRYYWSLGWSRGRGGGR
mmetsp:Transcript_1262/g.1804  ORF Transcript_1262/g.1804 Transcript_1262/m.1804 type:complete len:276 (-) Transcript_1262:1096-1923(-)